MKNTPLTIYQRNIELAGFLEDAAQNEAINVLQQLFLNIAQNRFDQCSSVYLWGRVGRGKTYVMDCFLQACQSDASAIGIQRIHYYRFMQFVHAQLAVHQGRRDPLVYVAQDLLKSCKVLCLDEFFVSDIGDAMLLGRLMKVLFEQGLVLVATSNVEPTALYKDGLQRDRFMPAIKVLEEHLTIVEMAGIDDHRLAKANGFPNYYIEPLRSSINAGGAYNDTAVYQRFLADAQLHSKSIMIERDVQLSVESRRIDCVAKALKLYCFSFEQLFVGPRAANDYIALSKMLDTLYLLNVPQMGGVLNERKVARGTEDTVDINQRVANRPFVLAKGDDEARRFISFIDEMYDQKCKVVIGCEVELSKMYLGGRVAFEFERTVSRIVEMQGASYLSK